MGSFPYMVKLKTVGSFPCLGTLFRPRVGAGGPKIFKGGGRSGNRAALGLSDSSLYNSPRHAAGKSFEINQLSYH